MFRILNEIKFNEPDWSVIRNLPETVSTKDILKGIKESDNTPFKIRMENLDKALRKKFGVGFFELSETYLNLHFKRIKSQLTFEDIQSKDGLIPQKELDKLYQLYKPLPKRVICHFSSYSNYEDFMHYAQYYRPLVIQKVHNWNQPLKPIGCNGVISLDDLNQDTLLNLHDNSIAFFNMVRADFDLSSHKHQPNWIGYYWETEKYLFFIKSSAQLDLLIAYQEKKQSTQVYFGAYKKK